MAVVDIRAPLDMGALQFWDGVISSYDSRSIVIKAGAMSWTYSGHFTYDSEGYLYGQLNGMTHRYQGSVQWQVGGLMLDASYVANMMAYGEVGEFMDMALRGADVIRGSKGADVLLGLGGADTLHGNGGNDVLDGGRGADLLIGGTGNDTYRIDDKGDRVDERVGEGYDHVFASVSHRMAANVEALTLTGSAGWALGNEGANRITGNALANVLDGGAGVDTLAGGAGNDVYHISGADQVIELAGGGWDLVIAATGHTLAANVEDLRLTGTAVFGIGNGMANILTGNDAANVLEGRGGHDILFGGGGNDTLRGGVGDDMLNGGAGADRFVFSGGRDVIVDFQDGQDIVLFDRAALGLTSRAEVLAACSNSLGNVIVDLGPNELIIRDVNLTEFRDSFALI